MSKRAVTWFITNAAFGAALWFGFVGGIEGAKNVAIFIVWYAFVGGLCAISSEIAQKLRAKGPPVPVAMDATFDVLVIGFLAWHGSWVLAAVYMVHTLALHAAYGREEVEPV